MLTKSPWKYALFFGAFISFFVNYIHAQPASGGNPHLVNNTSLHPEEWSFVENKGQLASKERGKFVLHPDIKYYGTDGAVSVYCKPGSIGFLFTSSERIDTTETNKNPPDRFKNRLKKYNTSKFKTSGSSAELTFVNADPDVLIEAQDMQEFYENFYLAHTPEQGITDVHTFKTIVYKNIYPDIALRLHAGQHGLKYEFVINPGGNINDIKMQWSGAENIAVAENGGIIYT